jgi:uncharacterized protein YgiB involved in biofilm formation
MSSRKRSCAIALTFLTGTVLAVGMCSDDKPVYARNQTDCVKATGDDQACAQAQQEAIRQHLANAPRFADQQSCIAAFGPDNCRAYADPQTGKGWFIPAMAGFMIGRMASGNSYMVQAACRDRNGDFYTNGCGGVYGPYRSTYAGRYNGNTFVPAREFENSWSAARISASRSGGVAAGEGVSTVKGSVSRGGFGGRFGGTGE